MVSYTAAEEITAVIAAFLLDVCTKQADRVASTEPDKPGQITNVLLALFCVAFWRICLFCV